MSKRKIFKQRTITGLIFGISVLTMLYSGKFGAILLGINISLLCHLEYTRMAITSSSNKHWITYFLNTGIFVLLVAFPPSGAVYQSLGLASVILFLAGIVNMYKPFIDHTKYYWAVTISYFGLPFGLFLSFLWNTTVYESSFWIMLICLIWMSDTFAYLVGSVIGKHKLMPSVSPGKTWEGFLGAGIMTCALTWWAASSLHPVIPGTTASPALWTTIAALVWFFGTLGDLVESSIKRTFHKKDSGNVLPGHGGILDRFDSFVYILPFILFLLSQIQNF